MDKRPKARLYKVTSCHDQHNVNTVIKIQFRNVLGPWTATCSSASPAFSVVTWNSAFSRMRSPLGWIPRPYARHAFGSNAEYKMIIASDKVLS